MAVSTKTDENGIIADINITPLTDVMLVLLIIFMVTATFFVAEPAMKVNLPPAVTAAREPESGGEISVVVARDGRLFVQGEPVHSADMVTALMAAAKEVRQEPKYVVVKGDKEAAYGAVIWVMDAARLVGLRNVSLATQETEQSADPTPAPEASP